MNTKDIPRSIRETWATYEFVRRLSFLPDEIWVEIDPNHINVVVFRNNRSFRIAVHDVDMRPSDFEKQWERFATQVNNGIVPDDLLLQIWRESSVNASTQWLEPKILDPDKWQAYLDA